MSVKQSAFLRSSPQSQLRVLSETDLSFELLENKH